MIFVARLSSPLYTMRSLQSPASTRLTRKSTSDFGPKSVDPQFKTSDNEIARNPSKLEEAVPETLQEALSVFLQHPTPLGTILGIICIASYRLTSSFSISDLIIGLTVGGFWIFQEWFMHRYLLHSSVDWMGRRIHVNHHRQPYHHVCIDDSNLVFSTMAISAIVFKLIFRMNPEGDTAILMYWSMGLMYIWCHFIVHTRYIPQNKLLRKIRQNHMKHHCKDSRYWFSFTCPWIDEVLNTTPLS